MKFKYQPINNKKQFGQRRSLKDIKFIVVHDTGNTSKGAGASNHRQYLTHATRSGSAHYYVDDKEIIQPIGDSLIAWAVGDTWANKDRTRTDVNNSNSLSVELCVNSDSDYKQALKNTIELVKNLMEKFNIPIDNIVRHYDATGKPCPASMKPDNWKAWKNFKKELKKPIDYIIDLEKSSDFKIVTGASSWSKYWDRATDNNIIDGTRPKDPATREEVIEILGRLGVIK